MNLFQKEEEEIFEYYDFIFKNFIFKWIMNNRENFLKICNKIKYYLNYDSGKTCNFFHLTKAKLLSEMVNVIIIFKKKKYLNYKLYFTFKKINIFLKKKTILILYKNFTKIFIKFTLYKIYRIQILINLNYKTDNKKNRLINIMKDNFLNIRNKEKVLNLNYFSYNYRNQNIDITEIISKILPVNSNLKSFFYKKYSNSIKKKKKTKKIFVTNFFFQNYFKNINIYFFNFLLIEVVNFYAFFFDNQFAVYNKSIERLLKVGLKFMFCFNIVNYLPLLKLYKKKHSNDSSVLKQILNCTIFKIENNTEKHSIYISPIEKGQFESIFIFILLKCGHVFIFDYFKTKVNLSFYKNNIKKAYIVKCPFCLFINNCFLKFIYLVIHF
nr:hypothetical protein CcurKRNrm1_p050 [Cryptomonas curvata]